MFFKEIFNILKFAGLKNNGIFLFKSSIIKMLKKFLDFEILIGFFLFGNLFLPFLLNENLFKNILYWQCNVIIYKNIYVHKI